MRTKTQQVSLPPQVAQLIDQQPDKFPIACTQRPEANPGYWQAIDKVGTKVSTLLMSKILVGCL